MRWTLTNLLLTVLFVAIASTAPASTTWYVNGVSGRNSNNCKSLTTSCKTIGHAISLASSGDSIMVAAGVYRENLTIHFNLRVTGAGASTTVINGGAVGRGVTVSSGAAHVTLSGLAITNGVAKYGGGIYNAGTLAMNNTEVSTNLSNGEAPSGGGVSNTGTLTISHSVITGNRTSFGGSGAGIFTTGPVTINQSIISRNGGALGGGGVFIFGGTLTINSSTLSGNASGLGGGIFIFRGAVRINKSTLTSNSALLGGGIHNEGVLAITNSTLAGNSAIDGRGGAINNVATLAIFSTTISGNSAVQGGGGIFNGSTATLQNSIIANSLNGGNCGGIVTSHGNNLSSDRSCNLNSAGDMNNRDPMLGSIRNNGGPTQTMALLAGSPAIDAGNPSGCTDGFGDVLKTDQRGAPRPDKEDLSGCDVGAFERQSD